MEVFEEETVSSYDSVELFASSGVEQIAEIATLICRRPEQLRSEDVAVVGYSTGAHRVTDRPHLLSLESLLLFIHMNAEPLVADAFWMSVCDHHARGDS